MRRILGADQGLYQTAELRASGLAKRQIAGLVAAGRLLHLRRGWYALPGTDASLCEAVRIGGRLTCASAAALHGWATPEGAALHVNVPANASRLRTPLDPHTVIHWEEWHPAADTPRSVVADMRETILQVGMCLGSEEAGAVYDSFLQREKGAAEMLESWLSELPDHVSRSLAERSSLCESFLESIGRIRLGREGITGVHQVQIAGVGRVDLVVDDFLVIEWDGRSHADPAALDEDRRRDALLASMGYRVLRFSYQLVVHEWHIVITAIRAALAGATRPR